MTDQPRLSIIPGWCSMDTRLKGKDLQVLCLLGRNASTKSGWTRRSQVKMAEQLACSRSTVQASLDRLIEIGAVERHVVVSQSGRDSAHWYRVIYDREPPGGYAFDAWAADDDEENLPPDAVNAATPPAGIPAPPAGPESAPPAGSGPAPINASCSTPIAERMERETAPGRDNPDEGKDDVRAMEKAFQQWFVGYPTAGSDNMPNARREWAKLTPDERERAHRRLPGWIAMVTASGRTRGWPAAASYLADRKFDLLDDVQAKAAVRKLERVAIKPFGPVWGGMRAYALGKGPVHVVVPGDVRGEIEAMHATLAGISDARAAAFRARKGLELGLAGRLVFPDDFERAELRRRHCEEGYPLVNRLHKLAADRSHEMADGRNQALADLCEAVPVGSPTYEAWRAWHAAKGLPPWPDPGSFPVVYFPKGGPDGMGEFMQAARAAMEASEGGRGDADAA